MTPLDDFEMKAHIAAREAFVRWLIAGGLPIPRDIDSFAIAMIAAHDAGEIELDDNVRLMLEYVIDPDDPRLEWQDKPAPNTGKLTHKPPAPAKPEADDLDIPDRVYRG